MINETLRLYPTIVAILPRYAVRDTVVAGVAIPAGVRICRTLLRTVKLMQLQTVVGTQNYTIHRNEKAFPEAHTFIPDRWLSSDQDKMLKEAFIPFSVGARSCIGIK